MFQRDILDRYLRGCVWIKHFRLIFSKHACKKLAPMIQQMKGGKKWLLFLKICNELRLYIHIKICNASSNYPTKASDAPLFNKTGHKPEQGKIRSLSSWTPMS